MIAKDLQVLHQQEIENGLVAPHTRLALPNLNYGWLRKWRRIYGVSARMANLHFKASRNVLKHRLRVFWCNVIAVRALHALLEPGGELVFESVDQKPLWFTASSQEKKTQSWTAHLDAVPPVVAARVVVVPACTGWW
jgi:hypothetical protein